ncbi:MAG: hypothetical protein WCG83_02990 [Candidatus Peregrinibacteria bacterium]
MAEHLTILIPVEGESWSAYVRRARDTAGETLLILSGIESQLKEGDERRRFFEACLSLRSRVCIATKRPSLIAASRIHGFRVITKTRELKVFLQHQPSSEEAFRVFSPHLWRQQLRSQLQTMGLLSLPKIRIWILILVSASLFLFVLFRLLPSATITVKPREDSITHTVNIFLVQSGAVVAIPTRVRTMPLRPIVIDLQKNVTFDQISKEFTGTSPKVVMTIVNTSPEPYSFRKGTRLTNQAGMIFRILQSVVVPPNGKISVRSEADSLDSFGRIVGERGNIDPGKKWEFPGLPAEQRSLVYAENLTASSGGTTMYRTVLTKNDLVIAEKQLQEDLLVQAKQMADEQKTLWNSQHPSQQLEVLYYDELTKVQYKDFVIPASFIGQPVTSVPIEGSIRYIVYAYDTQAVLQLLTSELMTHVREGKRLLPASLTLNRLVAHVIDYAEDFSWIKITVDLSGTEQYIIDPLSPSGALFARRVREKAAGMTAEDAARIIKNFPEVDSVGISLWPPWSGTLPMIPSHILIDLPAS